MALYIRSLYITVLCVNFQIYLLVKSTHSSFLLSTALGSWVHVAVWNINRFVEISGWPLLYRFHCVVIVCMFS